MSFIIAVLLCLSTTVAVYGGSADQAVGRIVFQGRDSGTGFVVRNRAGKLIVLTARHVASTDDAAFCFGATCTKLRLISESQEEDVASFRPEPAFTFSHALTWSDRTVHLKDEMKWCGYNYSDGKTECGPVEAFLVGETYLHPELRPNSPIIEGIGFKERLKEGFSGSPVVMASTEDVVGIIIQDAPDANDRPTSALNFVPQKAVFAVIPDENTLSKLLDELAIPRASQGGMPEKH